MFDEPRKKSRSLEEDLPEAFGVSPLLLLIFDYEFDLNKLDSRLGVLYATDAVVSVS